MKWLKDKIQQHKERKAAEEARAKEAERLRKQRDAEQRAKQMAINAELLKWRRQRGEEIRRELLAEWRAAQNTNIESKYESARDQRLSWVGVVSEEGDIKLESLENLYNGVCALESCSEEKIDTELKKQIRGRLDAEEASIKYANRIAEIKNLRPVNGDTWANKQLYALHPALCPMPDRVKIRRSIRKEEMKRDERNEAIKTALCMILGILLLPVIFMLWGVWKWNR